MAIDFGKNWAEFFIIVAFFIGFVLAIFSRSAIVLYALAALIGIMIGVWLRSIKGRKRVPLVFIFAGFVLGYLAGAIAANRTALLAITLIGIALGWALHARKIISG
ncbi:MAG: hypothetical protein QXN46_00180 [Candidatus Woesearchaeota archaeon]